LALVICTLHEVLKSDATDVILQHSLIISTLRVAKWWQNGKIGPKSTPKATQNQQKQGKTTHQERSKTAQNVAKQASKCVCTDYPTSSQGPP